ncbi:hypothetical protein J3A83DRAFT_4187139 [Scleroderma citrinum]
MSVKSVAWLQLCISYAPSNGILMNRCLITLAPSTHAVAMSEEVQMCLWDDSDAGLTDLELDNMDALCLLQLTLVNANKEAEFLLDLRKEDGMDDGAEGSTIGGGALNGVECIEELEAVGEGASVAGPSLVLSTVLSGYNGIYFHHHFPDESGCCHSLGAFATRVEDMGPFGLG